MSVARRFDLEPAFVVHQRAYRETSAIVEAFTREHGRVGVVARGVRGPRSGALRGALQPFVPLLMSWRARGELGTLVAAEPGRRPHALHGASLLSGLYMNELLLRLAHRNDPHPTLFDAYETALASLADAASVEDTLRVFEKRLLDAIGYALVLEHDAESGAPIEPCRRYAYRPDAGPTAGGAGAAESIEVSGATLLALAREQGFDDSARREAKRLLRRLLGVHLGGRPLQSRSLFRSPGR